MKQDLSKKQVKFLKTTLGTNQSKVPRYSREEMKTKMEKGTISRRKWRE